MTETNDEGDDRSAHLRRALESAMGSPFTTRNAIDILRNGDEIFPAMLDAIRSAERRIEFLTFIWWRGEAAREIGEALAERAQAGVEVFVMIDAYGGRPMEPDLCDRMERAGCRVVWFRPLTRLKFWRTDNRTHRKVLVVDGAVGFTGGVGLGENWEGDADSPLHWRDNHFRIRGPAVRPLRGAFWGNWFQMTGEAAGVLAELRDLDTPGDVTLQVALSESALGWSAIARLQDTLLRLARRHIRIQTPYFNPDETQTAAVLEARRRGVEVEFMIPGPHIDKRIAEYAGSLALGTMLEAGVKVWRFQPTMLHSKLILVDDDLVSVGSANFNARSVYKDDEMAVTAVHRGFAARMTDVWEADLARSELQDEVRWRKRDMLRRALERVGAVIRPQA